MPRLARSTRARRICNWPPLRNWCWARSSGRTVYSEYSSRCVLEGKFEPKPSQSLGLLRLRSHTSVTKLVTLNVQRVALRRPTFIPLDAGKSLYISQLTQSATVAHKLQFSTRDLQRSRKIGVSLDDLVR